jgi:hypothetical protein
MYEKDHCLFSKDFAAIAEKRTAADIAPIEAQSPEPLFLQKKQMLHCVQHDKKMRRGLAANSGNRS